MTFAEDLKLIEDYQKEIITLGRISGLLNWDTQTFMPKKAHEERADQLSYMSSLIHEKMVDPRFCEAVNRLKDSDGLNSRQKRIVQILFKEISKSKKLPKEFVAELAKERSLSFNAWQKAREEMDADIFLPRLAKMVELKKKEIEYRGYEGHPYNVFIDDYEEGMTVSKLDPVFEKLKKGLIELLGKIKESDNYKNQKKVLAVSGFDKDKQIEFTNEIAKSLGLDSEFSRLDFSEHPFSTRLGLKDARITTNVRDDPMFSIGSTIHETGHALYELGMPDEENYTFLGESPSYGMHESQSRFWENMIGLGKPFWKHFFPKAKELFDIDRSSIDPSTLPTRHLDSDIQPSLPPLDGQNQTDSPSLEGMDEQSLDVVDINTQSDEAMIDLWHKEINHVYPHYIRIESDEVHYCLHVILRYELEKGLMDGSISVDNIAEKWNEKMKEYFGLEVRNAKEGFMQDVHWSEGYFGYFPTYALGTIYAAQIYAKLVEEMEDVENEIASGGFDKIKDWLGEKIHKYGSMKMADDIITGVCGKGLDADDFLDYLNKKYGGLYGFS
jgi:carboxypeptidase Taq